MKTSIASAVLTSTMLLSLPALAQENAGPPVAPAPQAAPAAPADAATPQTPEEAVKGMRENPFFRAYLGALQDLKPLLSRKADVKQSVMALDKFTFSPTTKQAFMDSLGNPDPLHFKVETLPDGGAKLVTALDSLNITDPKDGGTLHTEAMHVDSVFNKDFNKVHLEGGLASVLIDDHKSKQIDIGSFSFLGDYARDSYKLWIGDGSLKVDHVVVKGPDGDIARVENIVVSANSKEHDKLIDIQGDYNVDTINWNADKVDTIHFGLGFKNIDAKELGALADLSDSLDFSKGSPENADKIMKTLKAFALSLSKHNGTLELTDISAGYHGQIAGLSGRATLPGLKESDFKTPKNIYQKLIVKIKVHVPLAMIDEISHTAARKIMEAQSKQTKAEVTDMAVDLVARGMVSKITDVLVTKQKWAHMENDQIVTVIDIKHGKLYLDNHEVSAKSNPFLAMMAGK